MNKLILVVENWKGLCEHNFVSTFEELSQKYMKHEDPQTISNFGACVDLTLGNTSKWNTYYLRPNITLDIRACAGKDDLKNFLTGEFNDSVEDMNERNPGSLYNDEWYWDNDIERFSPKAIDVIKNECPEQLMMIGLKRSDGKTSLADIIKKASFIQENISCSHGTIGTVKYPEYKEF